MKYDRLFKYGFALTGFSCALNRFSNGAFKVAITGPSILSSGTGHWPFYTFHLVMVTGKLRAWQVCVMGVTIGSQLVAELDENGGVLPDRRKHYMFMSAFNHQHKTLEEII